MVQNSKDVSSAVQNESLVLQAVSKRLRNARKRLRGIEDIQAKADAGQSLNSDQESALLQRSSVLAIVDELERLHKALADPLKQELDAARAASRAEGVAEATAAAALASAAKEKLEKKAAAAENKAAVTKARTEATTKAQAQAKIALETAVKKATDDAIKTTLQTLIELLYFASLLDPYAPYSAERAACLFSAQQSRSPLTQDNLNTLGYVGRLLTTKSYYSPESHRDALATCKNIAQRIISCTEAQVHPTVQPGITGKTLKQTVDAIKALEFFTLTPGLPQPAAAAVPSVHAGGSGSAVIGHAHTQQHSAMASAAIGLPQYPKQQQKPRAQPAAPALAAPVHQQQQRQIQLPVAVSAPHAVPGMQAAPEKSNKKEENLMNKFFGGGAAASVGQQNMQQKEQQQSYGSLSFYTNDSNNSNTNASANKDATPTPTAFLIAPTPTALPTPSPAVLTVPVAAKKRRNQGSRGSSQSRGSGGAGPVLVETGAAGAGGQGVQNRNGNKGKGGNAKKQAAYQVNKHHGVQHPSSQSHQQQQQQEQRPPAPISRPAGNADAATTNAAAGAAPRPNSKNRYYRKPRMQQPQHA